MFRLGTAAGKIAGQTQAPEAPKDGQAIANESSQSDHSNKHFLHEEYLSKPP
jgi:hypothetical protein